MKTIPSLHDQAVSLASEYQKCEAKLLEILIMIEQEKIHLRMGYPSLFAYCAEALKLSESQSYSFMTIAKKSKEVPELKEEIKSGSLSISKARRIVPVLTKENHEAWIEKAKVLPKAELEKEVSKVSPYAFKTKEQVRAVANDRVSVKLELKEGTWKKLKRAQVLIRNKRRKNLDLEDCLNDLLDSFIKKNDPMAVPAREKVKGIPKVPFSFSSQSQKPGPGQARIMKRSISQKLRTAVLRRDNSSCGFKGANGKICGSQNFLEVHHLRPWSQGGSHQLENLQTLCVNHHHLKHESRADDP